MKYDFTSILDRRHHDALALDRIGKGGNAPDLPKEGFDVIPMWVADMNFPVAPSITKALEERIAHPAYGYFEESDAYYDAIIHWHTKRNHVSGLEKKHIGYENGVLGGVISALNVFCSKGDCVLLHSPTYIGFTSCLTNNGYKIIHSPLYKDEEGIWRMNYEDMENKIKEHRIHAAILCSPYNPTGRVWEREELEKAIALFEKYQVNIVSDEIWSDLTLEDYQHIPTQSINEYAKEHTVALYAPTKTFNLAGLVGSYHIIYNDWLRERVAKEASLSHYNEINVLSMHALIGAYQKEGEEWVEELKQVLSENVNYGVTFINDHFEGVEVAKPQGTYMLYLECEEYCKKHNCSIEDVLKAGWEVGVGWQDGRPFHGPYAIRMNLASPKSRIEEAFMRLHKYVFKES